MALYPYQKKMKEKLLGGKSIIIQAPTGAGKTRGALSPYIEAFFDLPPEMFPRKCIYSVPMKVLANQFVEEYTTQAGKYSRKFRRDIDVRIQTGDRPDDQKFEGDLIFTTIDQTLSSFLNIPYALGSGQGNLNAGAVVSSYLVFDEFHLFHPDNSLRTTFHMLKMLKGITPFTLMTATFSSSMLAYLAEILGAEVIPGDPAERSAMEQIGSQVGKYRQLQPVDQPLTASCVLSTDKDWQRSICICNTVSRAQILYQEIKLALEEQGDMETHVCLLHSRFYQADRFEKEQWIRKNFGASNQEYKGQRLILVATQVIEVGVDVTCDVMHTELAPASSLLQRMGRCARKQNEHGWVFVYLPRDEDGEPDYVPYYLPLKQGRLEKGYGKILCDETWQALTSGDFSDRHISFSLEQELIDRVHKPVDEQILQALEESSTHDLDIIFGTMRSRSTVHVPELIRETNSRYVFLHPEPGSDENLAKNPWAYEGFSLSPGAIAHQYEPLQSEVDGDIWAMWTVDAQETSDKERPAGEKNIYTWRPLCNASEVYASPIIAIHPCAVQYSTDIGFLLETSFSHQGDFQPRLREIKKNYLHYTYDLETYAEHVAGLFSAYQNGLKAEMAYAVRKMERRYGLSEGITDQILRGIFACHDLGKLGKEWQSWAHRWQDVQGKSISDEYMAAHTDYDGSREQKSAQAKLGPRPPHAGGSALAAFEVLEALSAGSKYQDELIKAAYTAITRHHSAGTETYEPFETAPAARQAFAEALEVVGLPENLVEKVWWEPKVGEPIRDYMIHFDKSKTKEMIFYFIFVRILRLSDQRSQENDRRNR